MPSDDYSSSVGGGLKLKGGASIAKPSGIKKKKKKKTVASQAASDSKTEALQKALGEEDAAQKKSGKGDGDAEEELSEEQLRDLEYRSGDGKTASERAHEEMRRRRVCSQSALPFFLFLFFFPPGDMREMPLVIRNMFTDSFGYSYRTDLRRRVSRHTSSEWKNLTSIYRTSQNTTICHESVLDKMHWSEKDQGRRETQRDVENRRCGLPLQVVYWDFWRGCTVP